MSKVKLSVSLVVLFALAILVWWSDAIFGVNSEKTGYLRALFAGPFAGAAGATARALVDSALGRQVNHLQLLVLVGAIFGSLVGICFGFGLLTLFGVKDVQNYVAGTVVIGFLAGYMVKDMREILLRAFGHSAPHNS